MNKLAKYIIIISACAALLLLAWYFSSILICILISAVLSLIGRPIMNLLTKAKIKGIGITRPIASFITLLFLGGTIFMFFFFLFPMIGRLVREMSAIDFNGIGMQLSQPLSEWNIYLHKFAPTLDQSVTIQSLITEQLQNFFSIDLFTTVFTSFTSFIVHFCVSTFTIVFVTFFFLQDNSTFTKMLLVLVPEKYEAHTRNALKSIYELLVRYFTGISIEAILITILNTLGLHFIGGLDISLAVVLALISGVLNVIPYIGPIFASIFGTLMGVVSTLQTGFDIGLGTLIITLLLVFIGTHLIDVFIFQPYIYSNSVKAHPLEIFLIILIGGQIGGIIGMLIAIPTYTAIRVIAKEFFSEASIVKRFFKESE